MRKTYLLPLLVIFAFGVYGSTLSGGFLGDDYSLLGFFHQSAEQEQTVDPQWETVEATFVQEVSQERVPKYYRPLWFLSLYVDHLVFGLWSPGFRITNLLLFALSAFFLACLLEALTGSRNLALSSALLYLVLPTSYASVLWIADRTGQLAVCLQMLCLWCFVRSVRLRSTSSWAVALLCAAAALLSKETALVLFPLLGLLAAGLGAGMELRDRKRLWWSLAPFLVLLLVYFLWRYHILGTFLGGARDPGRYSLLDMAWNQFGVALSLLVPIRWPSMGPAFFWPGVGLAVGLLGGGMYLRRREAPWWPFFLLWFALSILPNALDSSLPGAQRNLRFTFPSSLPFVALVVVALQGWGSRLKPALHRPAFGLVLVASLVLLLHNRRNYVEAGDRGPDIVDRVLTLARTDSNKPVLVHGLPAWHGNAPLMLNAFPFLLRQPFLEQARRPFLAFADDDLGQLALLREAPRFLREEGWHTLRWDPLRQTLLPASLPRYEQQRGTLSVAVEGHLIFVPAGLTEARGIRVQFSRRAVSSKLDQQVEIRGLSIEGPQGRQLLIAEIRTL
jgi:hypothetical protein